MDWTYCVCAANAQSVIAKFLVKFVILSYVLQIMLLDFGASREYSRKFTDVYIHIIKSAAEYNRQGVLDHSCTLGFLTGYESKVSSYFSCFALIPVT